MAETSIQWTDHSINPIRARLKSDRRKVGHYCEKISSGCANCYSSNFQPRFGLPMFGGTSGPRRDEVELFLDQSKLDEVLRRKKPTKYFWCDMTDLFGEWVPDEWIDRCFAVMALTPHHTHQVLTKRAGRLHKHMTYRDSPTFIGIEMNRLMPGWRDEGPPVGGEVGSRQYWPLPNVWLGVSVENQQTADERIPPLLKTPAAVRFLSCEPLLSAVDLSEYIRYNPLYDINRTDGRVSVSGSPGRPDRGPTGRLGVEGGRGEGEPLEQNDDPQRGDAAPDRRDDLGRIQAREDHAPRETGDGWCPPPSVPGLLRADPTRADRQPQESERGQGGQQAGESGTGHIRGAGSSLDIGAGSEAERSRRGEEQSGETSGKSGSGDQEASGGRGETQVDSGGLRNLGQDSLEDRQRAKVGLSWLIVGGESGRGARPFDPNWARSLLGQCKAAGVAFFMKQMGSRPMYFADSLPCQQSPESIMLHGDYDPEPLEMRLKDSKGGDPAEWPEDLRVRQFPASAAGVAV